MMFLKRRSLAYPPLSTQKGRGAASRVKWCIAITGKNGFTLGDRKRPWRVINRLARSRGALSRQRKPAGAESAHGTGFSLPLGASSNFRVPPQGTITGQPRRTPYTDFRTELSEIRSSSSAGDSIGADGESEGRCSIEPHDTTRRMYRYV